MATANPDTDLLLSKAQELVAQHKSLQSEKPLSILRLSEPISSSNTSGPSSSTNRNSDVSNDTNDITPATLQADLSHYRDLFTKLHFSYIEQVTKEKYLRAIVGDPPILHTHQENVELETEVLEMKRQLKEKKMEVEKMVEGLKGHSKGLAGRWEEVSNGVKRVEELEHEIADREQRVATLRKLVEEKEAQLMDLNDMSVDTVPGGQRLGLEDTLALIAQREQEMQAMDTQIHDMQNEMPARMRECEVAERDLEDLEKRKNQAALEALEARRRKERGDNGERDEVEERGRWYRSQEQTFRGLGLVEG